MITIFFSENETTDKVLAFNQKKMLSLTENDVFLASTIIIKIIDNLC